MERNYLIAIILSSLFVPNYCESDVLRASLFLLAFGPLLSLHPPLTTLPSAKYTVYRYHSGPGEITSANLQAKAGRMIVVLHAMLQLVRVVY